MKKKWFRALDLANEEYLTEAAPGQDDARRKKHPALKAILASAACLALVLSGVWLLNPNKGTTPPGIDRPAQGITPSVDDGDYSAVIQLLSALKSENIGGMRPGDLVDDGLDGVVPETGTNASTGTGENYQEITDNQVEGIIEADRIKRTDKHIFYLNDNVLQVFSIAGKESKEVGSIAVGDFSNYQSQWEFYLSADGKTATVMTMRLDQNHKTLVQVIALDVSDPANITEKNRVEITGSYLSSRMTNGKILLMTEFWVDRYTMDFDDESTFLPQINGSCIPAGDIILPETANNAGYTVVLQLDENTLEIQGQSACLSYTQYAYVSQDYIFLTNRAQTTIEQENTKIYDSTTDILCLTYGETFEEKRTVTLRGYLKDKWSMDEYQGVLRVVTTTEKTTTVENGQGDSASVSAQVKTSASLYCVDLENFQVIAQVEEFAPVGEIVRSVRFDKTSAYVCTAVQLTDPVFFFDLSDLNNITYKDTGTIDGYSSSLVNFGNGYLLGIGMVDWSTLKIEIYRETENGVESVCTYIRDNTQYSSDYKSYYIDRENQLLGLGINDYGTNPHNAYMVLHFDGNTLQEVVYVEMGGGPKSMRGVYVDGYMYMFSDNDYSSIENFKVEKIF